MANLDDAFDTLWETEWIQIPGMSYIIKYKFCDDSYTVMITNLSEIYGERLVESEIRERFGSVNPYAVMKPRTIISKVKESLENVLSGKDNNIKMQSFSQHLTLRLQFTACQVTFIFDLCPPLLSCEKLRTYVIAPIVLTTIHTYQENIELQKKVESLEKSPIISPHKSKQDPKMKTLVSCLNKRSKVNLADVLESVLLLQSNIKKCVSDSKYQEDTDKNYLEQSAADNLCSSDSSLVVKDTKGLNVVTPSLKYEDIENEPAEPIVDESSDMFLPQKREVDSDDDSNSTVITHEEADALNKESNGNDPNHVKLKKKKPLNI